MFFYYTQLAWISLKRTPWLSAMMVLAVAMGIAANLTMLTIYSVMSNNPMAHKNDRIAAIQLNSWGHQEGYWDNNGIPVSLTYMDAKAVYDAEVAEQVVLTANTGVNVKSPDLQLPASVEETRLVTRDFFTMFDAVFLYGSAWPKEEDANGERVVVLSEAINDKLFLGNDSVGKFVLLDGQPYTIVGVVQDRWHPTPSIYDLHGNPFREAPKLYLPFFSVTKREFPNWGNMSGWKHEEIRTRQDFLASEIVWIYAWAGFSSAQNKAEFETFIGNYIAQQQQLGRYRMFQDYHLQSPRQWLEIYKVVTDDDRMLLGFSFAFLSVCLMNTAVLLLAKFIRNAPEAGLRRALGADRGSIFLQHMTEAMLVSCVGAVLGLAFSALSLEGIRMMYQSYDEVATVHLQTYGFAVVLALATGVLCGFLPALKIGRTAPALYLKAD
ncbi:FtsX-like permease family protein [Pseudomaricurvus alkylphenolicus]|uniref:ABC transporter permease n=1 Tax=Pseudomaricurvus alkylphenolicus TaxID=1306991 RepID=UPI0014218AEC|nr:ABC transporter permease [Pseudomaricurvus alkylphenolicus]NIB44321.1 FtsX-like permease family protein [Pseudomaricurvus alkylphenolicus]